MTRGRRAATPSFAKETRTVNFEGIVLRSLEKRCEQTGQSLSQLVNRCCRSIVLSDIEFYREMSRLHYLEFQNYQFLKGQAETITIVEGKS
jgi:hypothetical protein